MTGEKLIGEVRERARKNFETGYNCSEAVFEAVVSLVDTGFPQEVKKLATGFGGGVGLYGGTCGAIIGAVLAVSAVYGRTSLPEGEDKRVIAERSRGQLYGRPGLYRIFNQIPNRIKEKYGLTVCREVTLKWQDNWLCREQALYCREIITDAAGIAAELILADRDVVASRPFGVNVENLED